jgi:hypothetical protein
MRGAVLHFLLGCSALALSSCSGFITEQVVYDQKGYRVGVEIDPTIKRSHEPAQNDHPAKFTAEELQSLLGMVEVSGWSGTLVGILAPPRPVPLFKEEELREVSQHLAVAFRGAGPTERVFFSLVNRQAPYRDDRTAGALFLRGPYLHIVVTDHISILTADTGGGEEKDIRDTKGMKLWVVHPAKAAVVPDAEEPRWAPFETTHISINTREILALRDARPPAPAKRTAAVPLIKAPRQSSGKEGQTSSPAAPSPEDLQLQIRELTNSNLELRERIDEQTKRMKELTEEMERLYQELEKSKTKRPPARRAPSP